MQKKKHSDSHLPASAQSFGRAQHGNDRNAKKKHHGKNHKNSGFRIRSGMTTAKISNLKSANYMEGIFSVGGRDIGYVRERGTAKETSIEVEKKYWNTALHGDSVKVRNNKIVEIVVRAKAGFAGELKQGNDTVSSDSRKVYHQYYVSPADPKMYTDIIIKKENLEGAKVGDKVFCVITGWKDPSTKPEGKIVEVLGLPGENDAEMHAIALERGFSATFPKEVEKEADMLEKSATADFKNEEKKRRDFRKEITFTIDPYDAKDFDDALSFKKLTPPPRVLGTSPYKGQEELYEIGIHIADVSHFVRPETELDKEAIKRQTSVYLVDRTIPMLPEVLSNDLCSLKPEIDRLTMSAVITMNTNAEVIDTWFGKTIIHSQKRFSYEEAQMVLDKGEGTLFEELNILNTLAKKLTKQRFLDGAISLDQEEVKFVLDAKGVPQTVFRKIRQDTNKLIEEFMLLANRLVAEYITKLNKGKEKIFLYRIHDNPDKQKAEDLVFFLKRLGIPVKLKDGRVPSTEINRIITSLEGATYKDTVQTAIVRSMMKAIYSTKNIGHYGLAFEYYTHFTSPIRRYPDVIAHRLLQAYTEGKEIPREKWHEYDLIAEAASMREKEAADAERASIKYKQVEYMSSRVGEIFDGTVSGVTDFGIFVEEKETKCEGMIRMRDLGSDRWNYDERHMMLVGEKTKKTFNVGDRVKIKVMKADINKRVIDYALAL